MHNIQCILCIMHYLMQCSHPRQLPIIAAVLIFCQSSPCSLASFLPALCMLNHDDDVDVDDIDDEDDIVYSFVGIFSPLIFSCIKLFTYKYVRLSISEREFPFLAILGKTHVHGIY